MTNAKKNPQEADFLSIIRFFSITVGVAPNNYKLFAKRALF
jgi:hypothetical protein